MRPGRSRHRARRGRGGAATVGLLLVLAIVGTAHAATDPYRPQQWNLDRIGAPQAWEVGRGEGQVIAIVDSGVDLEHPDLVDQFVRRVDGTVLGRDVVDDDGQPEDPLGHGTMVAGIAVAATDNGIGVAGVAPDARLMPVRVLDEDGRGTSADVDEGIRWAVDNGATVINLSLESATAGDGDSLLGGVTVAAPTAAVDYAWRRGVVVVAAAGNSGNGFTDYPSSSPVVLVGATDRDDGRTDFSDSGRDDLLMAPGVDIVSTWCREGGDDACDDGTHSYGIADGTSFAAPHVAGAIAVLRSTGLDHEQAVDHLRATARDLDEQGRDDRTGYGLVDLGAAVTDPPRPASPGPTPSPSRGDGGQTPAGDGDPDTPPAESPTGASPPPADEPPSVDEPPPTDPGTDPAPTEPAPADTPPATEGGEITTPDVDATPIATPDPGPVGGRIGWAALAVALLAGSVIALARSWPQAVRPRGPR